MIDSSYPALTREIVRARASVIAAPRASGGYRRLLAEAGFREVSVAGVVGFLGGEPFVRELSDVAVRIGAVSVEEGEVWMAEQVERGDCVAVPQFLASGVV
ncbi:hypothetical protein [Amycolatopsis sp. cmx-11-32]|uniref:hypothetical protein n=1 Tax=Amycolatopsis sp. cmx-11-32 TaxID=2785796 RepID=UPI0039E4B0B0